MAGTPNQHGLGGDIGSAKPSQVSDTAMAHIYSGSGVPSNTLGSDGDLYHRRDTPTVLNQRLYAKSGGVWTGIL